MGGAEEGVTSSLIFDGKPTGKEVSSSSSAFPQKGDAPYAAIPHLRHKVRNIMIIPMKRQGYPVPLQSRGLRLRGGGARTAKTKTGNSFVVKEFNCFVASRNHSSVLWILDSPEWERSSHQNRRTC